MSAVETLMQAEIERLRAEVAHLREYLDTAQRRASALGDEVAGMREALERVHNDKSFGCLKVEKTQQFVIAALAARKGTT